MILVAFLVGNFAIAQQKQVSTEKQKVAKERVIKVADQASDVSSLPKSSQVYSKKSHAFVDFSQKGTRGLLIDNGPFVTNPGGGPNGSDVSLLESPNTNYGSNFNQALGYTVAEDFSAIGTWSIDSLAFFGYQTSSPTTSTFTGLYVRIWNGDPSLATSSVVWGDLTTNILTSTYWSGCYRATDLVTTNRPIMRNVAATPGLVLPAGDYWIEWTTTGSLSSGPWANAITVSGQPATGNAKQYTGTAWTDILDGTNPQGMPFMVYGAAGSLPTNDIAMKVILTPISGPNMTSTEVVSVRIQNNGTAAQSNIPVSYTINGGTAVNEIIPGPVAAGAQLDYTFTQTADLSAVQSYTFVATTALAGDEYPANDSKSKTVTNLGNMILMQNGTVTSCSGSFYDTGGPDGTYQISEDLTMTIAPSTPGAKMKFNFTAFDCENNWDFLKVYDGADVNAPMIGNFTGASIPPELVELIASQTNTSGAITFHFTSDNSVTHLGWAATMSCVVSANQDLAGVSVTGNAAPVVNTAATYTVTVANSGAQAVTGANYTVTLYDAANAVIGTANGVDIAAGESKTFDFSWTPTTLGATHLYGKVVLTGDENPANDQTPNFNVNVIQGGSNPVIYSSDFESFTAGGQVACQDPTNWTTWSNAPCSPTEDAFISTDFAQSGVNSIKDEGVNDLVLNMGNKTTGKYEYNFSMYVPSNFCGYYNVLQDFAGGSSKWGLEVYFHTDGTGLVNAGANNAATFTYVHDQWIPIKNVIDLDNDLAELIINGVSIYSWQWSLGATGTGGVNQLSASDFFAGADANFTTDVPKYYLDDITYKEYVPVNPPIYATDFESFTAGGQVACQDPTHWTTWSSAPCGTEDAYVSTDFAHGGVNAVKDELANDEVLDLGNKTTGKYQFSFWMYIPTNHGGYYNLLHNFAGSTSEWGLECYFLDNGALKIQTGADTINSSYNYDQWFKMTNVVDLDNDQASVYMNDNLLTTWQWSLNELNGNAGLNQLSAVDFFSGTGVTGLTNPLYYFDDIEFTALSAPAGPHIAVTPTSLTQTLAPNATATQTLHIANTGTADLTFNIDVTYPVKSIKIINHKSQYERVIEKVPAKGGQVMVDKYTSRMVGAPVDPEAYVIESKSSPKDNWLAANPVSGTVAAGAAMDIQVTFDAAGLTGGTYAGNLAINSNDAAHATINVPATLTVAVPGGLPLVEDWTSGSFATNDWTFDPAQSNWSVSTTTGNPAPSAQFGWSPAVTNYSFALVSEVLDATSITDNVTLKFDINLNNFSTSTLEGMAVEVFDGSAWQMVHDYQNTNGSIAWTSDSYNITSLAAGKTFKVRFRAYGANSYNINYWYVDNIKVYEQVVGNIAGTVTKLSDNTPVAGAAITMTNALSGTYTATTAADGTYAINGAEAGNYALTLSKEGYNVISGNVAITGNQTLTQNYQLTAPTIAVAPNSLTVTVPVGQTTTRDLTITNSGNGPLAWSGNLQSNKDQISIPASNGNFEHTAASAGVAPVVNKTNVANTYKGVRGSTAYGFDVNNGIFMSFDMDDPSNATTIANVSIVPFGGTFDASNTDFMYVIDYNDGAIKKVEVATGNVTTVGTAGLQSGDNPTGLTCDKSTGILYASSTNGTESMIYTIDPATGAATVIGPTGIPALIDIAIDGTGQMYGYDIVADNAYKIDKTNGTSTMIGSIGFNSSYAQGMGWDPASDAIYMAAYNAGTSAGELRLFDKVTGNTAVLGSLPGEIDGFAFPGGGGGNWASIAPNSGVIAPGATATVTVTFDGNYIPPQKDLTVTGNMVFASDPNVGSSSVALSMTISGEFTGILNGTVNHGTTPVEGVTVTATREESPVYTYSMVTGADGAYSFNPAMYGTYDITATKEGFNPYEALGIVVTGGQTTTHAIAMVAPIMVIDPLSITATAPFGQIITQTIHVTNNGDGSLEWTGKTIPNNKLQVSIPASNGNFEHTSASAGVAPTVNKTNVASAYKGAKGSIAYGFDVNNGIFMSFDMDDPSNATTIANVTITPFGGTFDASNTDFMYVIDYNDGAIKKVDIATGDATTVGAAGLQSGDTPTGLTCDKTDGTLYAASTNGSESMLYIIDPTTGASTVVGPTGIPALIDIAIDGDGQMYGYDIVGDNAYKIDKTNGTSTVIGSIGFDASYAQGMCWDPESDIIYMAAYNASTGAGELRLLDKLTGSTAVLGSLPGEIDAFAFPGGASKWLSIDPKTGILPAGASQDVTVTLDGNYIPPQKDYTLTGNILFTSDPNVATTSVPVTFTVQGEIYGILTGTVSHNGQPVAGVIVTAQKQGSNYSTTSGPDGVYVFPQVLGGSYTVSAEATGYCPFSTTGVVIAGGQTTTLNIVLTAPTMAITPQSLTVTLAPNGTIDQTIQIANNGDCMLNWSSTLVTNGKRSVTPLQFTAEPRVGGSATGETSPMHTTTIGNPIRAIWDILFTFNGNYAAQPGVETDGQYIYTSSWQSGYGSWFHKYALDGTWIEDFDIAGVTAIRDMAYDGQYFYGGANSSTIYQMDFTNKVLIGTINTTVAGVRHIAYDSQDDAFWVGGWSDIQEVNRSGAIINSGSTGLSGMYGSAYDPWTADGPYLWIFDQGGNGVDIQQYSIANGALTGVMHDASDIPGFSSGNSLAGGLCISNTAVAGKIALIGNIQNDPQTIFAYDLGEATAPWVTRTPNSGTLAPGSTQDVTVHFDATDLTIGTYTANITFTSNPDVGTVNVPITLNVSIGPVPTVSIANVTAMPGPISVPVHATNIVDMGSFQFSIEYDPALLTYTGASNWFAGIDAVTIGNPSPGHLTFVWAAEMQGINIPDGNFFNLDFTWTGTIGQSSTLVWSDDPTPREFGDYNGVLFTPVYVNGSVTGGSQPQPVLTVTPDNQNVAYPAGNTTFAVANTGQGTMSYTAAVTAGGDWLQITGGGSGGNTGTISVSFTENTSTTPRVGTITVTAPGATGSPKTVTVTQAGFTIEPIVTIANIVIQDTGVFTLPVNAMNIVNMGSFQFTIEYDPSLISYTGVSNWYSGIEAVTVGNPSAGHITFVWAADLNGINIPNGNFFDINFNWTAAGASIITPVTWSNDPTPQEFADYDGNIFVPIYVNGSVYYNPNGIPEIGIASNSVFPNPATDVVNIKVSNDIRTVQIMNNLGMVISSATVAQEKIVNLNTSNFSAGTYFVRFISENGKTTVKKLVIIK
jgi:hypothetical protein